MSDYDKIKDPCRGCQDFSKISECLCCPDNPTRHDDFDEAGQRIADEIDAEVLTNVYKAAAAGKTYDPLSRKWTDDRDLEHLNVEFGEKVIAKNVRPKYTLHKHKTVHAGIKAHARRSRRVFKQYLKTGSLRLLKSAERKITSWDFD